MKTKIAFAAFLSAAGLCAQGSAIAVTTVPATLCKTYGATAVSGLSSSHTGLYNTNPAPVSVICPVPRTRPAAADGYRAFVNGRQPTGTTLSCTLHSQRHDSYTLGASTFARVGDPTPGGIVRMSAVLTVDKVSPLSYQSVWCSLPPGAKLFDIELVQ
ncbi:hypothetical protein [Piscinibacter sp. XHJ-5]|uniref:hypothetical protein n=1 Tax=Piscinibacter sp. XHJ-5 TaxID=3037797 RepID=UPI0024529998|nr:hypothetical protein [Piscinibacter sp. XHJ-5]